MDFVSLFAGILIGLTIGILVAKVYRRQPDASVSNASANDLAMENLRAELGAKSEQLAILKALEPERDAARNRQAEELSVAKSELTQERTQKESVAKKCAELEVTNKLLEQQIKNLNATMEALNKAARSEFETLATKILDAKVQKLSETNATALDPLLNPLKEKLVEFSKSVEEKYNSEAKERHTLKSKIEELVQLNEKMAKETNSLTQALRGDSKVQGDWGELVLERILQASGLRPGEEYSAQASHQDDEGERFQPDFKINLPEGKHVIVDSKVSLTAYELSIRTDDPEVKKQAVAEHLKSIKKHMDELAEKHYSRLKGVNSPELVFMFVPIEPAYILAMQEDPELSIRAWKNNVAIVTSTTLLASLKTVSHIWRLERQNRNAQKIAEEAAKLYDKFVGFMEEYQAVGQLFDKGQKHFKNSMDRLKDGTGSVFKRLENMKELGVAPKKQLPLEVGE